MDPVDVAARRTLRRLAETRAAGWVSGTGWGREVAAAFRPRRGRMPGLRTLKTVGAATLAFVAAGQLTSDPRPVLAPLTALLVVQLTLYETLTSGLQRVASVVAGVLVAVGLAAGVGLTWWSLAGVILVSLVVGKLLRLGPQLLEVPISAMLVLAVGDRETVALVRVWETLIGAGVGVAVNALVAPPLYVQGAGDAIRDLAERTAALLREVARDVEEDWSADSGRRWADRARGLAGEVVRTDRALARAEQSMRLNPRGRRADVARVSLRSAFSVLEHVAVNIRGVVRALADLTAGEAGGSPYDESTRAGLARLLSALSAALVAFGGLAGADPSVATPDPRDLRDALADAREARDGVVDALRVDAAAEPGLWGVHGGLLASVDRVLHELDPDGASDARRVPRPPVPRRLGVASAWELGSRRRRA
jgi:hypothetical protein